MKSDRLSRRSVLTGAATALVAAPASALSAPMKPPEVCDVVVVGAGLSGLIAGRNLAAAKLSVRVLEADSRVGGRMVRKEVAGGVVDLGGQWVGPTQTRILTLLESLRIKRFASYDKGMTTLVWNGQKKLFDGTFPPFHREDPPIDPRDVAEGKRVWKELERIAATVPVEAPWKAPNAPALDRQTVQAWLDGQTSSTFAKWVVGLMARIGGSGAFEPDAASLLHMAWTQRQGPQSEGPETDLLVGGAGQVPPMLAAALAGSIVTGAPVTGIDYQPTFVVVHTADRSYRCKAVIVALPPHLVSNIEFRPALPPDRQQLQREMPMGSLIKVHGVYRTAFWRHGPTKLSGLAAGNLTPGNLATCEFTADSSSESGTPGILTSFIAGRRAEDLAGRTQDERRKAVLADYVRYFGPEANNIVAYEEKVWPNERWIGGAFTAYAKPGIWTQAGEALRRPFGRRVFWAGTEVATRWSGYFDGAVEAGQEAAKAAFRLVSSESSG